MNVFNNGELKHAWHMLKAVLNETPLTGGFVPRLALLTSRIHLEESQLSGRLNELEGMDHVNPLDMVLMIGLLWSDHLAVDHLCS